MSEFKLPTETIELPSKGLLYPEDSELAKGTVEIKYMTAKEEDILTNQSYIKDGTVGGDKDCPSCGADNSLRYQEGCIACISCGFSKCHLV